MLQQIKAIDSAIEELAKSKNMTVKKFMSIISTDYTQGELSYDLMLKLSELGYLIVKKV